MARGEQTIAHVIVAGEKVLNVHRLFFLSSPNVRVNNQKANFSQDLPFDAASGRYSFRKKMVGRLCRDWIFRRALLCAEGRPILYAFLDYYCDLYRNGPLVCTSQSP